MLRLTFLHCQTVVDFCYGKEIHACYIQTQLTILFAWIMSGRWASAMHLVIRQMLTIFSDEIVVSYIIWNVCVVSSHPAAPWSGTLRKSMLGCWGACLLPLSLSWLTLVGRNGRAVFPDVGLWLLWCCEFLWLAAWFAFFRPPFWWTASEHMLAD